MTKRDQIHEFYKKVKKKEIFISQAKITPARPDNTGIWDVNNTI